jgi:long-chain acyl-CoA synthetase
VDPQNDLIDSAPGEEGELLIRGPQVFSGYWNRPEETEEVLLEDGWFRTGDIVSVDKDYFVTIRDRIKELIITAGFNVSPSEVEDVLAEYPGVAGVSVVGLPRPGGGEDVVAAVVPSPGTTVDADALLAFARQHLAAYAVPRRVEVLEVLPGPSSARSCAAKSGTPSWPAGENLLLAAGCARVAAAWSSGGLLALPRAS